ncbi:MAG: lipopolysaccharide biosynthesis protein, partial [Nitrososphaeraceae archaeon]
MIKDLSKDIAKYLPSTIIKGIAGFASIIIITRLFPPDDYGIYSLVWATVNILILLIGGWLSMSIIRFYPKFEKDDNLNYFKSNIIVLAFISILIIGTLFYICILIIKIWITEKIYILMLIGSFLFMLFTLFEILLHFLSIKREVVWYSIFFIGRTVFGLVAGVLLVIFFKLGIEGLFWGIIISLVIALPLLWRKSVGIVKFNNTKISKLFVKEISSYSFPLVISSLAMWILSISDRYILQIFRGAHEVGIYSASYNISEQPLMLFISLFFLASGPISINIWEKNGIEESRNFASNTTRLFLIICIPLSVVLSVLSKPIITLMTGTEYIDGYKIVPFVVSGTFFMGLQQRFQVAFMFYKKTKFIMYMIIGSGLLNLILNFLLIPKYGYMAAAITTLVSYLVLFLLTYVFSCKFFTWIFPFKSLIKVVLSSIIMGLAIYFIFIFLNYSTIIKLILSVLAGLFI